jgi:hypothetical protein
MILPPILIIFHVINAFSSLEHKGLIKLSPYEAVKAHRVVRGRGSHILWTIGSQMAVRKGLIKVSKITTEIR